MTLLSDEELKTLRRIQSQVAIRKEECAGTVFKDGTYSFHIGSLNSVRVDSKGVLIWHSHPDGTLYFSLQDWLCFFYAQVNLAAVVTSNGVLILKKTEIHRKLHALLIQELSYFQGYSSIVIYRMLRIIENFFGVDLSLMHEKELAACFQTDVEILPSSQDCTS